MLLLSASPKLARLWGADGVHGRRPCADQRLRHTAPVHNRREMQKAERNGAEMLFVSPVFPTRTHAGAQTLGRVRFGLLARKAQRPVIALGGMTTHRAQVTGKLGAKGWAAIDSLSQR